MSVSQAQARATGAGDGLPLLAPRQDRIAAGGQAAVRRTGWRRLCLSSVAVGGTDAPHRLGRCHHTAAAGPARIRALGRPGGACRPLLVALVVATGICERIWPAERRPVLARGHVQDAFFLGLHAAAVIPLMTLLSVGAATLISGHAPPLWRLGVTAGSEAPVREICGRDPAAGGGSPQRLLATG